MLKRYFTLGLLLSSLHLFSQSPTKIQLVNADVLEYDEQRGEKVKRLIGNVVFKHDKVLMYCDSAYLYSETNLLEAFSNVRLKEGDSLNVYGDFLVYQGNNKIAEINENVRLLHKNLTLTTNKLTQNTETNVAYYLEGGNIVDGDNHLTSKIGYYYPKDYEFFFKDSVKLVNPEYSMNSDTLKYNTNTEVTYFFGPTNIISDSNHIYCENGWYNTHTDISQFNKNAKITSKNQSITADSLYYDRNKGYSEAHGNIAMHDTVENIIISGDFGIYFEKTERAMVTQNAMLTDIYDDDSLFMHADTFKTGFDSTGEHKLLFAYTNVKFFKEDLQGVCDSLIYGFEDSLIRMFNNPVLWSDENQMIAEHVRLKTGDDGIELLLFDHNAFISSFVDSNMYNQIKGKNMIGYFKDGTLDKIKVTGNGQTIYYAQEEDKSFIGTNIADCTDMMVYVKDNTIEKITFITKPDAVMHPMGKLSKDETTLRGFEWFGSRRPTDKQDIFNWR